MSWGMLNLIKAKWTATDRQPGLKGDFLDIETAILQAHQLIQVPNIVWVDATEIKMPATADSPAALLMSGIPNILHPGQFVNGGLTDGRYRENPADAVLDFDVGTSLWGSEKASQWYLLYGLAGNADAVFTLKAMPFMRVKSQASQVISLGTLTTPATGIGYGLVTDELVGGMIYVVSGASKGLMRAITTNNNDNSTGGAITYSGAALTLAEGDWFVVLPPGTNFRWLGDIFNNSSGNIVQFNKNGLQVNWLEDWSLSAPTSGPTEDIRCASPLAVAIGVSGSAGQQIGHPDGVNYITMGDSGYDTSPVFAYDIRTINAVADHFVWSEEGGNPAAGHVQSISMSHTAGGKTFAEVPISACRYRGGGAAIKGHYFKYPG